MRNPSRKDTYGQISRGFFSTEVPASSRTSPARDVGEFDDETQRRREVAVYALELLEFEEPRSGVVFAQERDVWLVQDLAGLQRERD